MKKTLINIIIFIVTFNSIAQISEPELENIKGIFYEKGNDKPFSGKSYTFYSKDKKQSSAEFANGILNGEMTSWYPNDKVQTLGNLSNGKKNGVWTAWFSNGNKLREGTYKENKEEGIFTWWFENGNLKKRGTYINGITNGKWTWYFANGEKESEGTLLNDRNIGKWFWWNDTGEIINETDFSNEKIETSFKNLERILVGKWNYIETLDKNNESVKHTIRKYPNGKEMKIVASGPNITINENGTYEKKFTEQNSDFGNWKFLSDKEIEYELVTPINSKSGNLITKTQQFLNKKWEKDGKGNYIEKITETILSLTDSVMKIQYQNDYILIYKKEVE